MYCVCVSGSMINIRKEGSEVTAPVYRNYIVVTPRPFNPRCYLFEEVWEHSRTRRSGKQKSPLAPEIEHRCSGHPLHSLITIPTKLPSLVCLMISRK
jgi:hypothetical protein